MYLRDYYHIPYQYLKVEFQNSSNQNLTIYKTP